MALRNNAYLETDLLKTFVTIAETGTFTAAARKVFRSASAVSMQIKRLEDQLGRPLFQRFPRHVTLTADGEALLVHAREILRLNDAALCRFRIPQIDGCVRFGVPDDFGVRYLPPFLSRFAVTHPLIEVDVLLCSSKRLLELFEEGAVDMILTVTAQMPQGAGEVIHEEALVWVGAQHGVAHTRSPIPLALSSQGCGCAWRQAALAALEADGIAYRIAYTSDTGAGQLAAVEVDLAIAPMPVSLVGEKYRQLGKADGLGKIGEYQLRLHQVPDASSATHAFADHVRDSFGAL